ncbi:MAG: hypothetical protein AAF289_16900 [Cyanobacteria bacterium P01_A01_bin.135]
MAKSTTEATDLQAADVGPGAIATFLYYFTSTTLLASFVAFKGLNLSFATGQPQVLGLLAGLLAGGLGAYFNRTVATAIATPNSDRTLVEVEAVLEDLGYSLGETVTDEAMVVRIYQRSPLRQLLSGQIYLQQQSQQLIIASRAGQVRQLQRRLNA